MSRPEAVLRCTGCATLHPFGPHFHGCPRCGAPLLCEVTAEAVRAAWEATGADSRMPAYEPVLPVALDGASLGEGATPARPVPELAAAYGLEGVWLKLEGANPTGSFKDRLAAVAVAACRALDLTAIATSSTGNAAAAVAAYAAAARLRCTVLLPYEAPAHAVRETERMGARAIVTAWEQRAPALRELVERGRHAFCGRNSARPLGNPYGLEGYKTIAYEIVHQVGDRPLDAVLIPCCGGDGIYGIWRGFKELHAAGVIARPPAMIGCQPAVVASVAQAFDRGDEHVSAVPLRHSVALSLTDELGGDHALWALRESGGRAVTVDEAQIMAAVAELGRLGLLVEPAGAVALAALHRLGSDAALERGGRVALVLTGGGHRWPATFAGLTAGERLAAPHQPKGPT